MSILEPIETVEQRAIIDCLSAERNLLRGGLTASQMKEVLDIYYTISNALISHFEKNWDVNDAGSRDLAMYVLKLPYPATYTEIKDFFDEVMRGRLLYLSREPIGDSCAWDMINSVAHLMN